MNRRQESAWALWHQGANPPSRYPAKDMTVRELRSKYLAFFQSKGHLVHPSGSLVPYWVTGELDESLLFNGAGMIQFKPYFRGTAQPAQKRLTTVQKCLRTGDIEEVGDASHLTFFEMLGNFSFGDYFKEEAIRFSWEFLTSKEWLGLDPKRLSFTVFHEDDTAERVWSELISAAGIDPKTRIFRLGEETNYWPAGSFSAGPPGPCGPNSEMFYWWGDNPPEGPYSAEDYLRDDKAGKWLEIWNDVFISYEWQGVLNDPSRPDKGWKKTGLPDLPFQSIDTGMGLERTAAVLSGFSSVYDTDAFQPILKQIEFMGGGRFVYGKDEKFTRAMRIVSDHLRSAIFCIGDGILPGSTGRGYVLRRLLRRAILQGTRVLGFTESFLAPLAPAILDSFGEVYPELVERRALILERLAGEEALFRRTLNEGVQVLGGMLEEMKAGDVFPGEKAFFLYDTFGFPLEVTQELCSEAGLTVDTEAYRTAMSEAQERSRGANDLDDVYGKVQAGVLAGLEKTKFVGYSSVSADSKVLKAVGQGDLVVVGLDKSPFYAESGGQVGDTGKLIGSGFELEVIETKKLEGVWAHTAKVISGRVAEGLDVRAEVDAERRTKITRHHTATHLLHAALRRVLGPHVAQAGSLVSPDVLRFDFSHASAMTPEQIKEVEAIVNEHVWAAQGVTIYEDVALADARAMGAMALFGEKYGDKVRVVQIGDMKPEESSFSRELCGGIHVRNTGQIGFLKIISEGSAASGVRRVTAVCGDAAYRWMEDQLKTLNEASERLKSNPKDLASAIDKTLEALKEEKRKREKLASSGAGSAQIQETLVGGITLFTGSLPDSEPADAQRRSDALVDPKPNSVAVLAAEAGGKLTFIVKAGPEAVEAGVHAGNLARDVAKITGGGGGGRPNFATAGGKDQSKKDEALAQAAEILKGMVKA